MIIVDGGLFVLIVAYIYIYIVRLETEETIIDEYNRIESNRIESAKMRSRNTRLITKTHLMIMIHYNVVIVLSIHILDLEI